MFSEADIKEMVTLFQARPGVSDLGMNYHDIYTHVMCGALTTLEGEAIGHVMEEGFRGVPKAEAVDNGQVFGRQILNAFKKGRLANGITDEYIEAFAADTETLARAYDLGEYYREVYGSTGCYMYKPPPPVIVPTGVKSLRPARRTQGRLKAHTRRPCS